MGVVLTLFHTGYLNYELRSKSCLAVVTYSMRSEVGTTKPKVNVVLF